MWRLRPVVIAFVGLTAYQPCAPRGGVGGPGEKEERFAGARAFVLPNPSGRNARFHGFEQKLVWFRRIAAYAADRSSGFAIRRGAALERAAPLDAAARRLK